MREHCVTAVESLPTSGSPLMRWKGTYMLGVIAKLIPTVAKSIFDMLDDGNKTDAEKMKQAHQIAVMALEKSSQLQLAQMEVNKEEARHPSIFVAGWRPWIGWVCGCSMAWMFVIRPFCVVMLHVWGITAPLPSVPEEVLLPVTLGMLGLRSFEKSKHVETISLDSKRNK